MGNYDHLLSPVEIRGKVYRNRMLAAPKLNMRDADGRDFRLLKNAAEMIKTHGALAFMELSHPGRTGTPEPDCPDIYGRVSFTRPDGIEVKAFDRENMNRTITRTDEYGGASISQRAKFPLEILKAVREAVGDDFLIELRISGSKRIEGGATKMMPKTLCR